MKNLLITLSLFGLAIFSLWIKKSYEEILNDLPKDLESKIHSLELDFATEIVARNQRPIGHFADVIRFFVPLNEMPPHLIEAFLSAEDKDYFHHSGFSFKSILRAAIANLRHYHIKQGASTITQQMVRHFFLTNQRTYKRKIQEIVLAHRVENLISKNKILEIYLNTIFLGSNSYGVEAASQRYFSKNTKDLTKGESALLAGLPKAPTYFEPSKHADRAKKRRNEVLALMVENGFLEKNTLVIEQSKPLILKPSTSQTQTQGGSYFLNFLREKIQTHFELSKEGLFKRGVKLQATLDLELQNRFSIELKRWVSELRNHTPPVNRQDLQAAGLLLNANSGEILAMQGGFDFHETQFNRSLSMQIPMGLLLNPLIVLYAMEQNFNLNDALPNSNLSVYDVLINNDGTDSLLEALGVENTRAFLRKVGLKISREQLDQVKYKASLYELLTFILPIFNGGHRIGLRGLTEQVAKSEPIAKVSSSEQIYFSLAKKKSGNLQQDFFAETSHLPNNCLSVVSHPPFVMGIWVGSDRGRIVPKDVEQSCESKSIALFAKTIGSKSLTEYQIPKQIVFSKIQFPNGTQQIIPVTRQSL